MSQTSYPLNMGGAFAGMIGDARKHDIIAAVNGQGAEIPFGVFMRRSTTPTAGSVDEEKYLLPSTGGQKMAGIAIHRHGGNITPALTGATAGVKIGETFDLMTRGSAWVVVEEAVKQDDPVYVRHTANGSGKLQLGAVRKDADSNNAQRVTGARFARGCTGAGVVEVEFDAVIEESAADSLTTDLAATTTGKGAGMIGVEDALSYLAAGTVEAALAELWRGRFAIETTLSKAEAGAGKTILADAKVPAGKKVYVDGFAIKVNGATAWADDTATKLLLQDLNSTPVVFVDIAKAGLGNAAAVHPFTASHPTLGAGWYTGGTAAKGLQLKSDSLFDAGSDLNVRVWGHIA